MNKSNVLSAYAAYSKNDDIRMQSSSGAVFSHLANYILSKSGVIYGVAMSSDCKSAEYIRVASEKELPKLRGSKYIQAKVGDTFKKVKEDLSCGKYVLFTGTGCQINGLRCYLGSDYHRLYCVDVVCHGVPSPKLWRAYAENIQKGKKSRLKAVDFRCKDFGWKEFGVKKVTLGNKQLFTPKGQDPYMRMFLTNISLRPSCYECRAKAYRLSDISVADFWGIDNVSPDMNDNKGISLVIVRSDKGQALFEKISSELIYKEVDYKEAIRGNSAENESVKRPAQREIFFENFNNMGFNGLAKKYYPVSLKRKIKNILLSTPLRKFIHR